MKTVTILPSWLALLDIVPADLQGEVAVAMLAHLLALKEGEAGDPTDPQPVPRVSDEARPFFDTICGEIDRHHMVLARRRQRYALSRQAAVEDCDRHPDPVQRFDMETRALRNDYVNQLLDRLAIELIGDRALIERTLRQCPDITLAEYIQRVLIYLFSSPSATPEGFPLYLNRTRYRHPLALLFDLLPSLHTPPITATTQTDKQPLENTRQ